ncbi:Hpt domain-containing protein [Luteimonas sp. RD2P54]|uniref:histidine kinase n=1 Tax=Luteimonas endophytica TaxID=3042023 RepID=A0ABT6J6L1_9GAMM|nr:Hpt domain-containing protein [Luteimonas endophytica]MDH5822202.1 Hpt domain-containing protein [Luteimonas endophytica]
MTALRDAIDYTSLGWIKPELDETLRQARLEIEAFVEDPTDTSRMRFCAGYLHQVQGTLRMVELYAPAMVAEEMERLAQALQNGETADRDGACASLMRGVVLLPDYLERLQGGHKDIPIVLLPLLNELRAARGATGLSESVLFVPDLHRPLPADLPEAAPEPQPSRGRTAAQLAELNAAMAAWPEHGAPADAGALAGALEALLPLTRVEPVRRMLWVAARVMHALRDGALEPGDELRRGFAGVVREARQQLQEDGFGVPSPETALEPTRQLLYHVANTPGEHAALRELRETFELDADAPSQAELDHARGSLRGRNRALLDTVAGAVKEDLLRVKDVLDLHLRTGERNAALLQPQVEALARVADTLGMLGLGVARTVVQQQREAMEAIVRGDRQADESTLLDIAGSLLYVDASLDDQVARLGEGDAGSEEDPLVGESRKAQEVIAREAIANFADARQAFVAFVETSWEHGELAEVPRLLQEVAGVLHMLELPLPAGYVTGVRRYTETELLARRRVPNGRQLDTLADALASLEYYLEALREQRGNRDEILDIARNSLEALGYWPLPTETPAAAGAPERAATDAVDAATGAEDIAAGVAAFMDREPGQPSYAREAAHGEVAETLAAPGEAPPSAADAATEAAPAPAPQAAPSPAPAPTPAMPTPAPVGVSGGFEATDDDIDDEIREVFLEEFAEEIDNLDRLLPPWRERPDDLERLRPIRRVFHTLKGSGRLVGARTLGEFSWKIESLLNRVLEGTRAASPAVVAMVDQAFYTLPQLQAALRGEAALQVDLQRMEDDAERIAAGDEAPPRDAASRGAALPPPAEPAAEAEPASGQVQEAPKEIEAAEPAPVAEAGAPAPAAEEMDGNMVPAAVDALLLEILDAEVAGHLATVDAWVQRASAEPTSADDALLRAVHTMNGAFAMAEVPVITEALTPAESYIRRLAAAGEAAEPAAVAAVAELSKVVAATVSGLKAERPQVPTCAGLAARLAALRDTLPEVRAVLPPEEPELAEPLPGVDGELSAFDLSAYGDLADSAVPRFGAPAADDASGTGTPEDQRRDGESDEAERLEAERLEAERLEAERLEAERLEAERLEAERLEAERLEAELLEAERLEAERLEAERLEAERLEAERLEIERLEAERLEAERLEAERLEAERLEAERLEAERLEAERLETERLEAERLEAERAEAERAEAERTEAERAEAERAEAERAEAERAEAERREAESVETERLETAQPRVAADDAEAKEAERAATERAEIERLRAEEEAEYARLEAEYAEQDRVARAVATAAATDGDVVAVPAAAEDPDEPLDLTGLDAELVDIFVEESGDLLDHSDGLLAQLREAPGEREPLIGLQRDLHTIKGGARMAGIMAIGELGHAMESLLEAVVEQRCELGSDGIPLLERGFDRLHVMVTRVGARRAVGASERLSVEFDARARGETLVPEAPETSASAPALPDAAPIEPLTPLSAPIGEDVAGEGEDISVRAPQEQVRIRADLLDRLVNYAGEVAIYRARLEQQLGAFRSAMAEMEQTNTRLRDQLRRLDIETEAQIIARFQREGDSGDAAFDPLELDRFSTLQQLSRALAESATDMTSLQGTLDDLTRQYETLLLQQSRVSSDLQEGLMRTRMVPFDALLPRLRRVVRQAASETGKQVQLRLDGAQGELDRNVLERMTAPLEHMLRNAVVHGLEAPERRREAGKPEQGTVRIAVRREGSEVVLEVGDDGRGLDREAIRRRAEERGLVRTGAALGDGDLDMMIFQPGFSTADEVSRLAGRGVGMDVVASEVRQLGGTLDIHSRRDQGTTFTLRLPQTLAVTQAVFVRIGETSFAVPIASVRGVGRITREQMAEAGAVYSYGGEEYALHDLGKLVGHAPARAEGHLQMPLLLIGAGELRAAVAVDQIIGNREIVVKPVGPQVASVPGIFGATIMGDGSVRVILDVAPLVRRQTVQPRDEAPAEATERRQVPLVMVVDDSVTMRKVTGRVLERHNLEVVTARDGVDALERMDERVPDLMLLDIEMPRMDGYELATQMKADARLRGVPIVMITSRTGEKHRQRAFEIGVERYLGKPYQENELMRNVLDLLGGRDDG